MRGVEFYSQTGWKGAMTEFLLWFRHACIQGSSWIARHNEGLRPCRRHTSSVYFWVHRDLTFKKRRHDRKEKFSSDRCLKFYSLPSHFWTRPRGQSLSSKCGTSGRQQKGQSKVVNQNWRFRCTRPKGSLSLSETSLGWPISLHSQMLRSSTVKLGVNGTSGHFFLKKVNWCPAPDKLPHALPRLDYWKYFYNLWSGMSQS